VCVCVCAFVKDIILLANDLHKHASLFWSDFGSEEEEKSSFCEGCSDRRPEEGSISTHAQKERGRDVITGYGTEKPLPSSGANLIKLFTAVSYKFS
jgi:hypothetical protein